MPTAACALTGRFTQSQLSRWHGAVCDRTSCRAFSGDMDLAARASLGYVAARGVMPGARVVLVPCQDELFLPIPLVGRAHGAGRMALVIADLTVPHAAAYAGALGEAVVLEATALGLASCWIAIFRRAALKAELKKGERVLAVIPIGLPAQGALVHHAHRDAAHFAQGDFSAWPAEAEAALQSVRLAPTALNRQGGRLCLTGRTLTLSGRISELEMGIYMLHMELAYAHVRHAWAFAENGAGAHLTREAAYDTV